MTTPTRSNTVPTWQATMSDLLGTAIGSFIIGLVVSFAVRAVVEWRHLDRIETWQRHHLGGDDE